MTESLARPWWDRWTTPHASVTGVGRRRRVRLAAALLLVLLALSVPYVLLYGLGRSATAVDLVVTWGIPPTLALAFLVVRSRHPAPGMWTLVLTPWVALAILWQTQAAGTPDHDLLYYSLIPLILASLVLNLRTAIGFAVINIAGIAALFGNPDVVGTSIEADHLVNILFFHVSTAPLILLGAGFLERSVRAREAANEKLREAERYRIELLNVIAHDLASPLTPVQLQMRVLQAKIGDTKGFDILQRNINHMQRLVGDVRDLSRIEMDRLKLDRRETDLATLVRQTAEGFAQTATERQITPDIQVDAALPVQADPDRLNQVLYNLMTNALKFSPDGSTIRIHATRNNGHARVIVQDQGRGLAPDDIPRLFQPFSQVHDRSQYKEKGTGLGLYISKGIVEGHGGRIWAESAGLGHGATFAFEIPIQHDTPT